MSPVVLRGPAGCAASRTTGRPPGRAGRRGSRTPWRLIPVQTREDAHLFREKVRGRTTDNDGRIVDAEDAEGRTLLWHAALHDDVQSAKCLLEHGCAHLILEPDYVHRLSPLQLAQKHSRRDLEDMFSSYVTATDRDRHWHHGRIEGVSPPPQRSASSLAVTATARAAANVRQPAFRLRIQCSRAAALSSPGSCACWSRLRSAVPGARVADDINLPQPRV